MAQPPSPPRNPKAAAQAKQWQEMSETEFSWNRYTGTKTDIVTDTKQRSSEKTDMISPCCFVNAV